jgi:hypothetical protein
MEVTDPGSAPGRPFPPSGHTCTYPLPGSVSGYFLLRTEKRKVPCAEPCFSVSGCVDGLRTSNICASPVHTQQFALSKLIRAKAPTGAYLARRTMPQDFTLPKKGRSSSRYLTRIVLFAISKCERVEFGPPYLFGWFTRMIFPPRCYYCRRSIRWPFGLVVFQGSVRWHIAHRSCLSQKRANPYMPMRSRGRTKPRPSPSV